MMTNAYGKNDPYDPELQKQFNKSIHDRWATEPTPESNNTPASFGGVTNAAGTMIDGVEVSKYKDRIATVEHVKNRLGISGSEAHEIILQWDYADAIASRKNQDSSIETEDGEYVTEIELDRIKEKYHAYGYEAGIESLREKEIAEAKAFHNSEREHYISGHKLGAVSAKNYIVNKLEAQAEELAKYPTDFRIPVETVIEHLAAFIKELEA
jgi:hypothetical protein